MMKGQHAKSVAAFVRIVMCQYSFIEMNNERFLSRARPLFSSKLFSSSGKCQ